MPSGAGPPAQPPLCPQGLLQPSPSAPPPAPLEESRSSCYFSKSPRPVRKARTRASRIFQPRELLQSVQRRNQSGDAVRTWLYDPGRLGGQGADREIRQTGGRGGGYPVSGLVGADEGQPPLARSSSPDTPWGQRTQRYQLHACVPVSPHPSPTRLTAHLCLPS